MILKFQPQPTNPLEVVLKNLSTNAEPVTMQFLDWVAETLADYDYHCKSYGDVVDFLEFMESNRLIELAKNSKTGVYTIKKFKHE